MTRIGKVVEETVRGRHLPISAEISEKKRPFRNPVRLGSTEFTYNLQAVYSLVCCSIQLDLTQPNPGEQTSQAFYLPKVGLADGVPGTVFGKAQLG